MYRLRTADKGRPLIVSDKVITEYSDGNVDTLHKKNLLSLGEDRYLTTLMMKHFPNMSYKFAPAALAHTAAPDKWSVLLSQRRRWINSTVHNLAELIFLKDMCGFCFLSMRFVIFIDLFGTIILPATCAYLGYLFYKVGTHSGQFPLISLIMLAAVYGLQAIIFIIKRQWQHVGWMIIYIIAFPIYGFVLPVYSFWKQDDFSWGSTRLVVEEKGSRKVVAMDSNERFDPRSVPLMRWDDYAAENNLPGRRNPEYPEKMGGEVSEMDARFYPEKAGMELYEMDARSMISSIKPGSATGTYPMMPINTMAQNPRASMYSIGTPVRGSPIIGPTHVRTSSLGGISNPGGMGPRPVSTVYPVVSSTDNLAVYGGGSPNGSNPNLRAVRASMLGASRPGSQLNLLGERPGSMVNLNAGPVNFMDGPSKGPSDADIIMAVRECLAEVDIERVTKKHVVALAELKLQSQLQGERKNFLSAVIDRELESME
jgi:chitin synthase